MVVAIVKKNTNSINAAKMTQLFRLNNSLKR